MTGIKKKKIPVLSSGSLTCQPALSAARGGAATFLAHRGLAAGSSQRGAGLSVGLAFEVNLCHFLLLLKDLLASFRLFHVEGE